MSAAALDECLIAEEGWSVGLSVMTLRGCARRERPSHSEAVHQQKGTLGN